MSAATPAATLAYETLIDEIAELEPSTGWGGEHLPLLSVPQVRVVLAARGQDVLDFLDLDTDQLAEALGQETYPTALGMTLTQALEHAARDAIWQDVLAECERRAVERDREHAEHRWARGDLRATDQVAMSYAGVPKELR